TKVVSWQRDGPIVGGWACIGVGIVLMFFSLMTFVLYGPLYLAAFILSIVGIAQGNTSKGIALLLCSIILPTVFGIGLGSYRIRNLVPDISKPTVKKAADLSNLKLGHIEGRSVGNTFSLEGEVKNTGSERVKAPRVKVY